MNSYTFTFTFTFIIWACKLTKIRPIILSAIYFSSSTLPIPVMSDHDVA